MLFGATPLKKFMKEQSMVTKLMDNKKITLEAKERYLRAVGILGKGGFFQDILNQINKIADKYERLKKSRKYSEFVGGGGNSYVDLALHEDLGLQTEQQRLNWKRVSGKIVGQWQQNIADAYTVLLAMYGTLVKDRSFFKEFERLSVKKIKDYTTQLQGKVHQAKTLSKGIVKFPGAGNAGEILNNLLRTLDEKYDGLSHEKHEELLEGSVEKENTARANKESERREKEMRAKANKKQKEHDKEVERIEQERKIRQVMRDGKVERGWAVRALESTALESTGYDEEKAIAFITNEKQMELDYAAAERERVAEREKLLGSLDQKSPQVAGVDAPDSTVVMAQPVAEVQQDSQDLLGMFSGNSSEVKPAPSPAPPPTYAALANPLGVQRAFAAPTLPALPNPLGVQSAFAPQTTRGGGGRRKARRSRSTRRRRKARRSTRRRSTRRRRKARRSTRRRSRARRSTRRRSRARRSRARRSS